MRALIVGILFLVPSVLVGQQEPRTLFHGNIEHGGFGGPTLAITSLANEAALLVGGQGAWLVDHAFFIGAGGAGLVTNVAEPNPVDDEHVRQINFGYGGLVAGYVHSSASLVHWKVQSLVGAGVAGYQDQGRTDPEPFFVVEPGAMAEINVTEFFRVSAGATYRYIAGVDMPGMTASDVSGPSLMLLLEFGRF